MAKTELNPHALGVGVAVTAIAWWLVGLGWHGMMGQPSMMMMLYPGTGMYLNPMIQGYLLIAFAVGGYLTGWLTATGYNWALKR